MAEDIRTDAAGTQDQAGQDGQQFDSYDDGIDLTPNGVGSPPVDADTGDPAPQPTGGGKVSERVADETPTEVAESKTDPDGDEEPPQPKFQESHLAAVGLTEEQAKAQFGTPDALAKAVQLLDRQYVQAGQQAAWLRQQQQLPVAPPLPPQSQVPPWFQPQQAPAPQIPWQQPWQQQPDPSASPWAQVPPVPPQTGYTPQLGYPQQPVPPLPQQTGYAPQPPAPVQPQQWTPPKPSDGQEWDEDTVALVRSLHEEQQKALQARDQQWQAWQQQQAAQLQQRDTVLQQQHAMLSTFVQERENQRLQHHVAEVDNFVNSLGDTWKPLLGEGTGYALNPASLAIQNRIHLDNVATQMAIGRAERGQLPLSQTELLARALPIAFPDVHTETVRKQVTDQVVQRQGQMTQRPSGRRSQPMTGTERALRALDKFYKERGIATHDDLDSEVDGV